MSKLQWPLCSSFHSWATSLFDPLFPSLCLICETPLEKSRLLCPSCQMQCCFLEPKERSSCCFLESCICEAPPSCAALASTFAFESVASPLLSRLERGSFYLARGLASLMNFQLCRLHWPKPDYITSLSLSKSTASSLLAREMGHLLKVPRLPLFKARGTILIVDTRRDASFQERVLPLRRRGRLYALTLLGPLY